MSVLQILSHFIGCRSYLDIPNLFSANKIVTPFPTWFKHLVTLRINNKKIILPKLYHKQYYISRKVDLQGSVSVLMSWHDSSFTLYDEICTCWLAFSYTVWWDLYMLTCFFLHCMMRFLHADLLFLHCMISFLYADLLFFFTVIASWFLTKNVIIPSVLPVFLHKVYSSSSNLPGSFPYKSLLF